MNTKLILLNVLRCDEFQDYVEDLLAVYCLFYVIDFIVNVPTLHKRPNSSLQLV